MVLLWQGMDQKIQSRRQLCHVTVLQDYHKPIDRIFAELQQTLGTHGAKQISFDYGDDGKVHGVQFVIKVNDRFLPIKLPARVEKAQAVLKKQWEAGVISHKRGKEQTYGNDQA